MSRIEDRYQSLIHELVRRVDNLEKWTRGEIAISPLFDIQNENTPAALTGNENNYDIGFYDTLRMSSTLAVTITGLLRGKKGRVLRIFNVGSYPITLSHLSGSSAAANQFKFSNAQSAVIPPSSNIALYYDSTNSKWIGGDTASSGAVYLEVENLVAQSIASGVPTKIDPGTVVSDQYGFYDNTNNQVVIQFPGAYLIIFSAVWSESLSDEYPRLIEILVNTGFSYAVDLREQFPNGADIIYHTAIMAKTLATNDVVEFYATHLESGGTALNLNKVRVTLLRVA